MSLWERVSAQVGIDQVRSLYRDLFPVEVRMLCAAWIEERIEANQYIDINDPQYEQCAANFISNLIQELNHKKQQYEGPDQLLIKCQIEEAVRTFTQNIYNPANLYSQIRNALMFEQHMLDSCVNKPQMNYVDTEVIGINEKIEHLRTLIMHNTDRGNQHKHEMERFMLNYSEKTKLIQGMTNNDEKSVYVANYKRELYVISKNVEQQRSEILGSIRTVIDLLDEVQKIVIYNRLGKWQRDQALAGNGEPFSPNALEEIQTWFEVLNKLIWNTRTMIDTIRKISLPPFLYSHIDGFENSYRDVTNLLRNLIVSGFIVEKQPPQVMKTNTRFAATVRLLLADASIHLYNPIVAVSILSEVQSRSQQQNHKTPSTESSGEILNKTGHLELQEAKRHLTCDFKNMQLKKIRRAEKRANECVMDEKFSLLFQSKFQIGDMQLNVWVMSLPVVVIVHGNQEPQSWATITWDNAFSDFSRTAFEVTEQVPWSRMASALNMNFFSQTGRSLTPDNLYYLCEKAYRSPIHFSPEERPITWSQFCKETLPNRAFTFWEWFYAAMKLTRHKLHELWKDQLILGFINKRQAEEMLMKCAPGTFLLRFSESELGGITIAWVGNDPKQIIMLQPFCHKDFDIRSLADTIKDLDDCVYLYPDIPKDNAFGKYYTRVSVSTLNGYVNREVKIVPVTSFNNNELNAANNHEQDGSNNLDLPEIDGLDFDSDTDLPNIEDIPMNDVFSPNF